MGCCATQKQKNNNSKIPPSNESKQIIVQSEQQRTDNIQNVQSAPNQEFQPQQQNKQLNEDLNKNQNNHSQYNQSQQNNTNQVKALEDMNMGEILQYKDQVQKFVKDCEDYYKQNNFSFDYLKKLNGQSQNQQEKELKQHYDNYLQYYAVLQDCEYNIELKQQELNYKNQNEQQNQDQRAHPNVKKPRNRKEFED